MLISGGAKGADTIFKDCAERYGHAVKIYKGGGYSPDDIRNYDNILLDINSKYLGRTYPTDKPYVNMLLRRDIEIAYTADTVYAIGYLEYNGANINICGGTAWGCYAFIERYRQKFLEKMDLYLYIFIIKKNVLKLIQDGISSH